MLLSFKEQKKAILSMELERAQRNAGIINPPKRPRLQGDETIEKNRPNITPNDFEKIKYLCPILEIFDKITLKVLIFLLIKKIL
jgi:hypothetical protein